MNTELIAAQPSAVAHTQASNMATPALLLQIAVEKGADLDRLERLMNMQIQWEEHQAKRAFVAAMAAFKSEDLRIYKDKQVSYTSKGGRTEYAHATLGNVVATIAPALARHGLSHRWETKQDRGFITVTCSLTHQDGHSESIALSSGADESGGKNSIQAIGSTVSYLQRYTLLAITGLATSDYDDDGNGGSEYSGATQAAANERVSEPPKPKEKPPYPAERFSEKFSDWESLITTRGKTPQAVIRNIETTHTLNEEQRNAILSIGSRAAA